MAIVAYGYGLDVGFGTNVLVDAIIIALDAEPDITIDNDVNITLEADDVGITLDEDIDIEVE